MHCIKLFALYMSCAIRNKFEISDKIVDLERTIMCPNLITGLPLKA